MIFPEYPCLFFHSLKTAGTSVEQWLMGSERFPPPVSRERLFGLDPALNMNLQHAPPEVVHALIGDETFRRCYKFTVVRNPFARVVSMYFYQSGYRRPHFLSFEDCVRALPDLLRDGESGLRLYYLPQICYTRLHSEPCCDAIVRFEDLPGSLAPVAAHLGIRRPLPFMNDLRYKARGSRPASSFYTPALAQFVLDAYAEDFAAFGYSSDPAHSAAALPAQALPS